MGLYVTTAVGEVLELDHREWKHQHNSAVSTKHTAKLGQQRESRDSPHGEETLPAASRSPLRRSVWRGREWTFVE